MIPTMVCCRGPRQRSRMHSLREFWYRLLDWIIAKLSIDDFPDKFA